MALVVITNIDFLRLAYKSLIEPYKYVFRVQR